jgi:hypothetical protein
MLLVWPSTSELNNTLYAVMWGGWSIRMDIFNITIKLATDYIGLWGMTRILGKTEISQLTPSILSPP